MKKVKCNICSNTTGKRVCKNSENSVICPSCCAKTRTNNCQSCLYYTQAENYKKDRDLKQKSKTFLTEIDPEVDEKVDYALELAEKGRVHRAEGILSTLINEHSHIYTVQFGMGVVCLMKNHYDEAIHYFNAATEINPYFIEAWYNKGAAHQKKLEFHHMINAYRKVIELGDYSEDIVMQAKSIIRDFEKQIQKITTLRLDEYFNSMAIFEEAFSAMERMEWAEAISGFKTVLSMDPKHTQTYSNLGICYGQLGEKQEALENFDKALELDPNYEPAIINRNAISSLADGEKLPAKKFISVDYYKDKVMKKKKRSLINRIFRSD